MTAHGKEPGLTPHQILRFGESHAAEAGWVGVCLLVTLALGAVAARLARRERAGARAQLDESGGLSEEMVLVFPLFLFFLALTVQLMLLLNARLMVNYAAYVAGRSASVWIPAATGYEPPNQIYITAKPPFEPPANASQTANVGGLTQSPAGSPTEKFDRVSGAAVLACAPISPNYFAFMADLMPIYGSLYSAGANLAAGVLGGVSGMPQTIIRLGPRWLYANQHTYVYFGDDQTAPLYSFGPNDDIKVNVEHDFYLGVPWAAWALGQGPAPLAKRYIAPVLSIVTLGLLSPRLYYVPITESYVFHNEGERLAPGY